jgi:hypothetical protein
MKAVDIFSHVIGVRRGSNREDTNSTYQIKDDAGTIRKYMYKGGPLHSESGPAVEYIVGRQEWWKNGEKHRLDGPAVITFDGKEETWIEGKQVELSCLV